MKEEHFYRLEDQAGGVKFVKVTVEPQDEHFVSSSSPVDEHGNLTLESGSLAPKFYGMTKQQAHRRMVDTLENSYEEVRPHSIS